MFKTLAATAVIIAASFGAATAHAGPKASQQGTLEVVSVDTWGGDVTFDVWLDPPKHAKDTVNFEVDDVYITLFCTQDPDGRGAIHYSIWAEQTGTYSGALTANPSLEGIDPTLPGWCDAWLMHTTIKGNNHTIEVLDQVTFAVAPA